MFYLNIRRKLSTAFHPQTDGQTERMNQVLEHYLRVYCNYRQDDWTSKISLAEFVYNNSVHASTGMSPFRALYGFDPELRYIEASDDQPQSNIAQNAKARVEAIDQERAVLKSNLQKAVAQQQKYYNRHHLDKTYKMGDLVMLSTSNLEQGRYSKKLSDKFIGPCIVKKVVGSQAYQLELPDKFSKIHNVFHVSLLEPWVERTTSGMESSLQYPEPELIQGQEEWEVESIIAHRVNNRGETEYLVRWKGYRPGDDDTWEPDSSLANANDALQQYLSTAPAPFQTRRQKRAKKRKESKKAAKD